MTDNTETTKDKPINVGGRPRRFKSVRAMTMAINKYFASEGIPTKAGLTLHLGFVNKVSLHNYKDRSPEFAPLINKTFMLLEKWWEERLAGSQCSGATFWLKNNAGYTDKQELSKKAQVIEEFTPEQLERLKHLAGLADNLKVHRPDKEAKEA